MEKALKIHIKGIVQGVGYRPFVYNLATELDIKGWVNNSSDGLYIHAEGNHSEIFYLRLLKEKPPLANILFVEKKETEFQHYQDFNIIESKYSDKKDVLISPDVATCPDCVRELFDPKDRRYQYPFINCTNCGPRYSIIYDRPYDRNKTTMIDFVMCEECREEYTNPLDRRFHAQPVACDKCGPRIKLLNAYGEEITTDGIGIDLLEDGAIFAVKGLGGYHLVCDASNHDSVSRLRKLKERGAKPFAVMVKNFEKASTVVWVSEKEQELLSSPAAPIVLLHKKRYCSEVTSNGHTNINEDGLCAKIAPDVAPGLHTLGMMMPYTPVHHLLFQGKLDFLVMTSANVSGQPLIYSNEEALAGLKGIADYFLMNDRDIYHPIDDSVVQVIGGELTFIRRARGYVPFPILLQNEINGSIVGLGGEMKNSFCLANEKMAFMSQYIGDMHGFENLERFKQEYETFQKVANIYPDKVAYDLHPEYSTTRMAKQMNCPGQTVQHHHAHLVSVMAEYGEQEPALGLICDGTGYGQDGRIWGFEYIYGNHAGYERKAHLEYLPLPGGDAGAKHPLRIAYAYLKTLLTEEQWSKAEPIFSGMVQQEKTILDGQLKSGFQLYETSSAGRFFDAISGILGVCTEVTYEGQAAVELESTAIQHLECRVKYKKEQNPKENHDHNQNDADSIYKKTKYYSIALNSIKKTLYIIDKYKISNNLADLSKDTLEQEYSALSNLLDEYNVAILSTSGEIHGHEEEFYQFNLELSNNVILLRPQNFFQGIVGDYLCSKEIGEIALCFHYSLACAMLEAAMIIGVKNNKLFLGGGVFHNKLLTEILLCLADEIGIQIVYPKILPSGDGGLALGQVIIANHALK